MRVGHVEGDLRTRLSGPDDEHAALLQLGRVPVGGRVQLHDARVELGSKCGHPLTLVCTRRHHDVVGLEAAVAGHELEAVAVPGEAVDADARLDR